MFEEYQPLVQKLFEVQRKQATELLADARSKISRAANTKDEKDVRQWLKKDFLLFIVHTKHYQKIKHLLNSIRRWY